MGGISMFCLLFLRVSRIFTISSYAELRLPPRLLMMMICRNAMGMDVDMQLNPVPKQPLSYHLKTIDFVGLFTIVTSVVLLLVGFNSSESSWVCTFDRFNHVSISELTFPFATLVICLAPFCSGQCWYSRKITPAELSRNHHTSRSWMRAYGAHWRQRDLHRATANYLSSALQNAHDWRVAHHQFLTRFCVFLRSLLVCIFSPGSRTY